MIAEAMAEAKTEASAEPPRSVLIRPGAAPEVTAENPAAGSDVLYQVEWIGVQVRWVGLILGFLLVNISFLPTSIDGDLSPFELASRQATLNKLLTAGALMVTVATIFIVRGRPLMRDVPLLAVGFEAVFVTALCYFDRGLLSPFRFYYFISLVIFALRFRPLLSWWAWAIYSGCYASLVYIDLLVDKRDEWRLPDFSSLESALATVALLMWANYVASAIGSLLFRARRQLRQANAELRGLNDDLERRIDDRTEELKESQALLVQREKQSAFGLLAAGIAHEVGNPLAGISSVTQMLGRHLVKQGKQDEYSIEKLSVVDQQLRRIQRTLRELTDFSRPANPQRTRTDLASVCGSALQIAKYYARRKGKTIEESYEPNLPPVTTVRDELVQVVLNLVLNAMDATEEGGTVTVDVRSDVEGLVAIRVTDDGCGVPADKQGDLFEPYFTTKDHGTGLGLFVCRRIVEQSLFGRIELESSRPGRTTFAVHLPTAAVDVPQDSTLNITMLDPDRRPGG